MKHVMNNLAGYSVKFAYQILIMKKIFSTAAIATVFFAACNNAAPQMDEATIQAKVDSTVGTKLEELNTQAGEDLDRRMAIEVKPKADSIVAARMAEQGK